MYCRGGETSASASEEDGADCGWSEVREGEGEGEREIV